MILAKELRREKFHALSEKTHQDCVLSDVPDCLTTMRIFSRIDQTNNSVLIHIVYVNDMFQLETPRSKIFIWKGEMQQGHFLGN